MKTTTLMERSTTNYYTTTSLACNPNSLDKEPLNILYDDHTDGRPDGGREIGAAWSFFLLICIYPHSARFSLFIIRQGFDNIICFINTRARLVIGEHFERKQSAAAWRYPRWKTRHCSHSSRFV